MYEQETREAILDRMLATIPSTMDKRQGAIIYDTLSPTSLVAGELYIQLDKILQIVFPDTTYGEWLDKSVASAGLTRKPSVVATGTVTFTGTDGIVVPIGTRLSTNSDVTFVTTTGGTISGGTLTLNASAEVGGQSGNVSTGSINTVLGDLSSLAVTNASTFTGGVDTEDDISLLARYYQRVRNPATSGNANHYLQWATEVAGVGRAKVFPLWNGAGTVKVVIFDSNNAPASAPLVASVQTYINDNAPIGPTITVESATSLAINISANINLKAGFNKSSADSQIASAITTYLKSINFSTVTVQYNEIAKIIKSCEAINDFNTLTVNSGTTNITLTGTQIAVIGTVTTNVY